MPVSVTNVSSVQEALKLISPPLLSHFLVLQLSNANASELCKFTPSTFALDMDTHRGSKLTRKITLALCKVGGARRQICVSLRGKGLGKCVPLARVATTLCKRLLLSADSYSKSATAPATQNAYCARGRNFAISLSLRVSAKIKRNERSWRRRENKDFEGVLYSQKKPFHAKGRRGT